MLVVADSSDEAGYVPDLQDAGYVLQFREPNWHEHRFLIDHEPDVQVHVFSEGSQEVRRMLVFRDRLRTHAEDRDLYERTKRSWPISAGPTARTTPTPSHRWSRRSLPGPKQISSPESASGLTRVRGERRQMLDEVVRDDAVVLLFVVVPHLVHPRPELLQDRAVADVQDLP